MENNKVIIFKDESVRIDKYLAKEIPDVTRSQIQLMISQGQILVNDSEVKANYILKENDEIVVEFVEPVPSNIIAQDIPLDVYYEDEDVIVVNKPSGMVVHPAPGNYTNTLVNALLFHCHDLSGINGEIRAGIVHRIDKDTSGLLVACKNNLSHKDLSKQFADKKVTRKYFAICVGVIPHNVGKVTAPIGRDPNNRQQMAVVDGGKEAVTHFRVIERFKKHTFVELLLETGRTHQIRVHMKYIGYPLAGDPIYGPKGQIDVHGQFLHAQTLGFTHPRTHKFMEFECPLPDYYKQYLDELENEEK
jgi:23S rRNA pseudouridine1911/1915/1917 synthase